ncbi:MAG: hypothetical protein JSR46_08190 [Verrucomicrobia bacterium]|nr:hypothetical protein [Verrucomicrobiota bacterium]
MVIIILILTLFSVCVSPLAATPLSHLEAGDVDYDGKKITLVGAVHLTHQFGAIACDKAVIILPEREGEAKMLLTPQKILLYGNVNVQLRDGSTISSEEADINCPTLEGVFTANPPLKVVYSTLMVDGKETIPVKASSRAMRVIMKKSEGPNSSYVVHDMQAEGSVQIEYQNALRPKEQ